MSKRRPSIAGIYLRGIAMGAADVVPGVSGGTVAFITGIYQELLSSISAVNLAALNVLFSQGPGPCWRHINGNFLLALLLGILTSVLSLAHMISYLLEYYPLYLWSYFFGLIVASSLHIGRQLSGWNVSALALLLLGTVSAYSISQLSPVGLVPGPAMIFGGGALAICAMILPGISGSLILVLLGLYGPVLEAVKNFQWLMLLSFTAGCGVGLLLFSRLLSWLFSRFQDLTLALLTGFLLGSLNIVWPWKHALRFYQNSSGEQRVLSYQSVLPSNYEALTGGLPNTAICLLLMAMGLLTIALLGLGRDKVDN